MAKENEVVLNTGENQLGHGESLGENFVLTK